MLIRMAITDDEIMACYPVMCELRPHLTRAAFLPRIRAQQNDGYRLTCVESDERVVAVAGHRILQNLAWGRFLYIDDLVTLGSERSKGYGQSLLKWLRDFAREQTCDQLHLDSGIHRKDAHRFYEREGLPISSYHFSVVL